VALETMDDGKKMPDSRKETIVGKPLKSKMETLKYAVRGWSLAKPDSLENVSDYSRNILPKQSLIHKVAPVDDHLFGNLDKQCYLLTADDYMANIA
jgi:hypothetical protein